MGWCVSRVVVESELGKLVVAQAGLYTEGLGCHDVSLMQQVTVYPLFH